MTELLSASFRAANYLSLAVLGGGPLFLLLSRPHADAEIAAWRTRWRQRFPWILAVNVSAMIAVMLLQAALTTERSVVQLLAAGGTLEAFLSGTRYGRIGVLKVAAAALMLLPCLVAARTRSNRWETRALLMLLGLAAATGVVGPLAGHAAGDEQTRWLMPLHMLHVLAVSAWLGGLPLWISLIWRIGRMPDGPRCTYAAITLMRFSRVAIVCMVAIVGSGILLTWGFVDTMGDLFGTPYGLFVCGKVLLLVAVLAIANHARLHFLPRLTQRAQAGQLYPLAVRWVAIELLLAVLILGLAGFLSQATPAIHDQPSWWLPFRISVDATWPVAPAPMVVSAGLFVLLTAALVLAFRWQRLASEPKVLGVIASVVAVGVVLWQLSVPAFPDTYRRSISPYLTVSIVQGKRHFEQYCVACHGPGGLGDGPLAKTLPKPPANLSEPHTALHTAGDMFWWLTEGMPEGGMPGFPQAIDEQARWDVINFLRAFSQGFEARLLMPWIEAARPWLGAPNFYFEEANGTPRELKDFRENSNVLLVFPASGPGDELAGRLRELAESRHQFVAEKLEIIVIGANAQTDAGNELVGIRNGAEEIREAYDLLSRTVSNRGSGKSLGMDRQHMEFLIDRFGYIRGRWIPEDQPKGWNDINRLRMEVVRLNAEPRIRPPPDDHVH